MTIEHTPWIWNYMSEPPRVQVQQVLASCFQSCLLHSHWVKDNRHELPGYMCNECWVIGLILTRHIHMSASFLFYSVYSKWVLGYRHEFDKVYTPLALAHCLNLEYIYHECWVTLMFVWWVHEPPQYMHHEYWLTVLFLTQYFYNKFWRLGYQEW